MSQEGSSGASETLTNSAPEFGYYRSVGYTRFPGKTATDLTIVTIVRRSIGDGGFCLRGLANRDLIDEKGSIRYPSTDTNNSRPGSRPPFSALGRAPRTPADAPPYCGILP